jgi:hypothetical protein
MKKNRRFISAFVLAAISAVSCAQMSDEERQTFPPRLDQNFAGSMRPAVECSRLPRSWGR